MLFISIIAFVTASVLAQPSTNRLLLASTAVSLVDIVPGAPNLENLALRHDGDILVTSASSSKLHLVTADHRYAPVLIADIPYCEALLGIAEMERDVFYIIASNLTSETSSNALWQVDLRKYSVSRSGPIGLAKKLLTTILPAAQQGNGFSRMSSYDKSCFLLSDSINGSIFKVNVRTGTSKLLLSDPIMQPLPSGIGVGVNGVHTFGNRVFFNSLDQGIFASFPISPQGSVAGPIEIIARNISFGDDFALSPSGKYAYLATNGPEEVLEIDILQKTKRVLASSHFLGAASSVAFISRGSGWSKGLYVTGGLRIGNSTVGNVARIELS